MAEERGEWIEHTPSSPPIPTRVSTTETPWLNSFMLLIHISESKEFKKCKYLEPQLSQASEKGAPSTSTVLILWNANLQNKYIL